MLIGALTGQTERLKKALESETRFGVGTDFQRRRQHEVMDEDWSFSPIANRCKDKAWSQLGTSGSGNHFVEFGTLTFERDDLSMKAGTYLALLSHSGSRGTGNEIATYFSKLALGRICEKLEQQKTNAASKLQQERWDSHNELERGNPVRVYEGDKFKLKKTKAK